MIYKRVTIIAAFSVFAIYALFIISLFYFFKKESVVGAFFSERTLFSIKLSIFAATMSTLCSLIIAIPSAYALSRYRFKGKETVDTILELPMIVSPAALGAMILIFFNNPLGNWIRENIMEFVFAVPGIILAQFVTTVGIATRLIKSTMDEIPTRYEDVARSLGASPFKAFLTVTLPLSKNGIIAGGILTWAKAIGEFGATITVAGTMAMKTETLPIAIFMKLASADIEGAIILILILVIIGLAILYVIRLFGRKKYA